MKWTVAMNGKNTLIAALQPAQCQYAKGLSPRLAHGIFMLLQRQIARQHVQGSQHLSEAKLLVMLRGSSRRPTMCDVLSLVTDSDYNVYSDSSKNHNADKVLTVLLSNTDTAQPSASALSQNSMDSFFGFYLSTSLSLKCSHLETTHFPMSIVCATTKHN